MARSLYFITIFSLFFALVLSESKVSTTRRPFSTPKPHKVLRIPQINLSNQVSSNHSRVFGGSQAKDGQFPYMVLVLVRISGGVTRCSAALITDSVVLLAAHCFPKGASTSASDVVVVAGGANLESYMKDRMQWEADIPEWKLNGLQDRRVYEVILHREYSTSTFVHDLAVLRVVKPFIFNDRVKPIQYTTERLVDIPCVIAGWGSTENTVQNLQLVYANHIRTYQVGGGCTDKTEGDFYCLVKGSSGICQGDSGSPLVCDNKVYGVASHYLAYSNSAGCGDDEEEYYADLSLNKAFLEEAIGSAVVPIPKEDIPKDSSPGTGNRLVAFSFLHFVVLALGGFHFVNVL